MEFAIRWLRLTPAVPALTILLENVIFAAVCKAIFLVDSTGVNGIEASTGIISLPANNRSSVPYSLTSSYREA